MEGAGKALKSDVGEAERIVIHLRDATKAQTELSRITESHARGFDNLGRAGASAWKAIGGAADASIAKTSSGLMDMVKNLAPLAGKALAAALGPIGIALAAAAGGVAALKSLADAGVSRQRAAFGVGTTTGKASSFGVYGNQFLGVGALQSAANAQRTYGSSGSLQTIGIDWDAASRMSPGHLAMEMLKKTAEKAKAQGGPLAMVPAVMQYMALGGDINDVQNALMMGGPALDAAEKLIDANAGRMGAKQKAVNQGAMLKQALEGAGVASQSLAINTSSGVDPTIAKIINFATGAPNATRDTIAKTIAGGLPGIKHALEDIGTTVVHATVPALHALAKAAAEATRALTTPLTARAAAAAALGAGESGGDWRIVNTDSGALGKWQFMPGAIADEYVGSAWVKKYGSTATARGRANFLGSPKAQTAAFNSFYDELYRHASMRTKDPAKIQRMIALGWYGGEGSWNETQAQLNAPQYYGGHAYPSQNAYADRYEKLIQRMRSARPPTINVRVYNSTQSRVSVSTNAAALSSQF